MNQDDITGHLRSIKVATWLSAIAVCLATIVAVSQYFIWRREKADLIHAIKAEYKEQSESTLIDTLEKGRLYDRTKRELRRLGVDDPKIPY